MADTKISALTAVATAATTNEFPVNEAGTSKKVTIAQLVTLLKTLGMPSYVWTETEIDFGTNPSWGGSFTVTDANSVGASIITVVLSGNAPTSLTADEVEWDTITFAAKAGTGDFLVKAAVYPGPVSGKRKILYIIT